jgi:hypothetical protein
MTNSASFEYGAYTIVVESVGAPGINAEVAIADTITGDAGTPALVEDLDPNIHKANLQFTVPQGTLVEVGATTTSEPGSPAIVTDRDPSPNRVLLDFVLPRGDVGPAYPYGDGGTP